MKKVLLLAGLILLLGACGNTNELENKIAEQKIEIEELQGELEKSEGYASTLETYLDEAEEVSEDESEDEGKSKEEVKLTAGTHYFGEDVEPGRYIMKPDEGTKGNVYIRNEDDDLKDAVALGDGSGYSEKEYTFYADDGDEIETSTTIILYPKE